MTTTVAFIFSRRSVWCFAFFVATAGCFGQRVAAWGDEPRESAPPETTSPDTAAWPSVRSRPDVVLVVGAGGEAEFETAFRSWAMRWKGVAESAGATLTWIGAEPEGEQPDRERLRQTLAGLEPAGREPVWIVLMGHGTFGSSIPKFNLRGPDLAADELAQWLLRITRPLVVVNASSCSGPFINALSGPGRVVVTATQSGGEHNYSRFGDFLSRSIADPAADIDHDGEVSILEAFLAASAGVREFYRSSDRLPTETALIDDNGDGLGTPATAFRGTRAVATSADPKKLLDGKLAGRLSLAVVGQRLPFTDEELRERDEIEAALERLRQRKPELTPTDYRQSVLPFLLRLAKIYDAAERRLSDD